MEKKTKNVKEVTHEWDPMKKRKALHGPTGCRSG